MPLSDTPKHGSGHEQEGYEGRYELKGGAPIVRIAIPQAVTGEVAHHLIGQDRSCVRDGFNAPWYDVQEVSYSSVRY